MTLSESSAYDPTIGYCEALVSLQHQHTAETNAAYLLSQLRPGLRILDFGCGFGAISVGLANAVDPGELHGVGTEESQIVQARALAEAQGKTNAVFHVGNLMALPFDDDYFDVAHCHCTLMHIPDPQGVLIEVRRVLKPGGIIACREMILGSTVVYPDIGGAIRTAWNVAEDILSLEGGHPEMGKNLQALVLEAGFTNIHSLAKQLLLSQELMEALSMYGSLSNQLGDRLNNALDRWKDSPEAAVAIAFGEAVANKP